MVVLPDTLLGFVLYNCVCGVLIFVCYRVFVLRFVNNVSIRQLLIAFQAVTVNI